jgi:hypothetical protein
VIIKRFASALQTFPKVWAFPKEEGREAQEQELVILCLHDVGK